jgi:putative hydrolase of the HAD superfamily
LADIRAITFDADETLWAFDVAMRAALTRVIETLAARHPDVAARWTIDQLVDRRDRLAEEHEGKGRLTIEAVRRLSFVTALRDGGIDDPVLAEELATVYFHHRHGDVALFDDVVPAFDRLAALVPAPALGLVSNGNIDPARSGLPDRFAFQVYADREGVAKPDPAIYAVAIARAGCAPAELLHVGDSLRNDVAAAQAAGCRAVWLDRNGADTPDDVHPDATITSLSELPLLLTSRDR